MTYFALESKNYRIGDLETANFSLTFKWQYLYKRRTVSYIPPSPTAHHPGLPRSHPWDSLALPRSVQTARDLFQVAAALDGWVVPSFFFLGSKNISVS